ncbi:MAG: hypothetical protein L0312_24470, partial [Acidobacteria bacterium]|nr:hypothetical protein [Acidobacteriota bacterium]
EEWSVERGRADLLRMYRSHASGTSPFAVDKGPNTNLVRAGFLARCFPDGRFVVVFRSAAQFSGQCNHPKFRQLLQEEEQQQGQPDQRIHPE